MKGFGVTVIRQRGPGIWVVAVRQWHWFLIAGTSETLSSMRSYIRLYESQMFQILGHYKESSYYCSGRNTVLITAVTYHIAGGLLIRSSVLCSVCVKGIYLAICPQPQTLYYYGRWSHASFSTNFWILQKRSPSLLWLLIREEFYKKSSNSSVQFTFIRYKRRGSK